jgi:hypothetical protein
MPEIKPDAEKGMTFTAKVRLFEAACKIDYPTEQEQNFRIALMKSIGMDLNLSEVRNLTITGPGKGRQRPQGAA